MKVIKDGAVYLLGDIISKLMPFLMLPYITRQLGAEGFGQLSFLQVFVVLGAVIIGMSHGGAITRYYFFYGHRSIAIPVVSGAILAMMLAIPVIIVCLAIGSLVGAIVVSVALTQELVVAQLSLRQCQKKPFQYIKISLLNSLFNVLFVVTLFEIFSPRPTFVLIGALLANLVALLWSVTSLGRIIDIYQAFDRRKLLIGIKYIAAFGVPLLLHQFSIFAKGQADRFFVYNEFGAESLGIYSASFQVSAALSVFILAANKAFLPYFYEGIKSGLFTSNKVIKVAFVSAILPLITFLASKLVPAWLFLVILGDGYRGAEIYFPIFLTSISMMVPYLILVNYLFYFGKTTAISLCTSIATVLYVFYLYLFSKVSMVVIAYGLVVYQAIPIVFLIVYLFKVVKSSDKNNSECAKTR